MLFDQKINTVYDYFSGIKLILYIDAQIKIAYAWRRYKKTKQKKLLQKKKQKELEDARKKKKKTSFSKVIKPSNNEVNKSL